MIQRRLASAVWAAAWLAAPAALSLASQFGSMAYFARQGGAGAALDFQTMLSLWAWTLVGAFGIDRGARGFKEDGVGVAYAKLWRKRLGMVCLAGLLLGLAAGVLRPGLMWIFALYGLCVGLCSMGFSGREWLLAQGRAVDVAKIHSAAFASAAGIMVVMAWLGMSSGWVGLMWFVPHSAVWLCVSAHMGLFRPNTKPTGQACCQGENVSKGTNGAGLGTHAGYGLQAMGQVALCSLDMVAAKFFLGSSEAFAFVVYSRLAFAAYLASTAFGSVFVGRAFAASARGWTRQFIGCTTVHAAFSLAAVAVLLVGGPWLTQIWLGMSMALSPMDASLLAMACLGRSVTEAGMQTVAGPSMQSGARVSAAGSFVGLALFAGLLFSGVIGPMAALALAWLCPSICLLGWVLARARGMKFPNLDMAWEASPPEEKALLDGVTVKSPKEPSSTEVSNR